MSERQKKVDRYLRAADAGSVSLVLILAAYLVYVRGSGADLSPVIAFPLLAILIIFGWAMIYLFIRRGTDEFTLSLWHSGVTAGFITLILWGLFGNMIVGAINGISASINETPSIAKDTVDEWNIALCIAAFFASLQFKRLKG